MVPDLNFVVDAFGNYNSLIFESKLPRPSFKLTNARTFRGKLCYKVSSRFGKKTCHDFEMRISRNFDLPQSDWEDVIIHEMIHLFIASRGIKDTSAHGPAFRKEMHRINRQHGRKITVSARSSGGEAGKHNADKRVKAHYVFIGRLSDGRLCMAPAAKTRLFQLWDMSRFFPGVNGGKWIGSTDPWFNAYPHVQTPKLYIIKEEDLLPHLKGAILLDKKDNVIKIVNRRCNPDELLP